MDGPINHAKYNANNLIKAGLVGATLLRVTTERDAEGEYGDEFLCFVFQTKSKEVVKVWVLSDPEGNGPGFCDFENREAGKGWE